MLGEGNLSEHDQRAHKAIEDLIKKINDYKDQVEQQTEGDYVTLDVFEAAQYEMILQYIEDAKKEEIPAVNKLKRILGVIAYCRETSKGRSETIENNTNASTGAKGQSKRIVERMDDIEKIAGSGIIMPGELYQQEKHNFRNQFMLDKEKFEQYVEIGFAKAIEELPTPMIGDFSAGYAADMANKAAKAAQEIVGKLAKVSLPEGTPQISAASGDSNNPSAVSAPKTPAKKADIKHVSYNVKLYLKSYFEKTNPNETLSEKRSREKKEKIEQKQKRAQEKAQKKAEKKRRKENDQARHDIEKDQKKNLVKYLANLSPEERKKFEDNKEQKRKANVDKIVDEARKAGEPIRAEQDKYQEKFDALISFLSKENYFSDKYITDLDKRVATMNINMLSKISDVAKKITKAEIDYKNQVAAGKGVNSAIHRSNQLNLLYGIIGHVEIMNKNPTDPKITAILDELKQQVQEADFNFQFAASKGYQPNSPAEIKVALQAKIKVAVQATTNELFVKLNELKNGKDIHAEYSKLKANDKIVAVTEARDKGIGHVMASKEGEPKEAITSKYSSKKSNAITGTRAFQLNILQRAIDKAAVLPFEKNDEAQKIISGAIYIIRKQLQNELTKSVALNSILDDLERNINLARQKQGKGNLTKDDYKEAAKSFLNSHLPPDSQDLKQNLSIDSKSFNKLSDQLDSLRKDLNKDKSDHVHYKRQQ